MWYEIFIEMWYKNQNIKWWCFFFKGNKISSLKEGHQLEDISVDDYMELLEKKGKDKDKWSKIEEFYFSNTILIFVVSIRNLNAS